MRGPVFAGLGSVRVRRLRQAFLQLGGDARGQRVRELGVVGVAAAEGLRDHAAQAAAGVVDAEDEFLVAVAFDELGGDELEQVRLAAFVVAEDQQVLVHAEQVEQDGREALLVDAHGDCRRFGGR